MPVVDVIVPAGGEIDLEFSRVVGTKSKALISLEGKTVLARIIEALRACPSVRRIVLVGSKEVQQHADSRKADEVLDAGNSAPENIFRGLDWLQKSGTPPEHVMIVTGDLPFLTAETLDRFLELASDDKGFCVPLISKEDWDEVYPGAPAMFVGLRDGMWTTGCVYLAQPRALHTAMTHIERVFQRRKSKLKIAMMLGLKFVWDLKMGKLSVADVERKVTELLGVDGVAVPGAPVETAFDIDYTEDYHYALQYVKGVARRAAPAPEEPAAPGSAQPRA